MYRRWRLLIVFSSMLIYNDISAKNSMNELTKVYHHRIHDTQGQHIDLGKIVFYFTQKPVINPLPHADDTHKQSKVFFFPVTKTNNQVMAMLTEINRHSSPFYQVHFEQVAKPVPGITCTITFDPEKIGFLYETFDSIGLQKGLVFRFYNKHLIEQLNNKQMTVLRTAFLEKPAIVIDCGHGGTDDGTVGFFNIKEKDVTRSVGLQVAQLLQQEGYPVFLTRVADESVELDARTTFANTCKQAALMVSIHANSAPNNNSRGIETFCLTDTLFKPYTSVRDARLTNYLHLLNQQSTLLAHAVHDNVLASVKKKQNDVVDRKVKHSVSQVLIGSIMPSALIEIGFLSNKDEALLLRDQAYQKLVAHGICNGICAYLQQVR